MQFLSIVVFFAVKHDGFSVDSIALSLLIAVCTLLLLSASSLLSLKPLLLVFVDFTLASSRFFYS
jgi:hypothetical protein